jgi:hypothetical protein
MLTYKSIYKKNILHSVKNPKFVKVLMLIEIIPLILVLDDIILQRSFNAVLFVFYILSPVTWFKYLSYLILTQDSTIPVGTSCQKENPDILFINYIRYLEGFDYNSIVYEGNYFILIYLFAFVALAIMAQILPMKLKLFAYKDSLFVNLAYVLFRYASILFFLPANDQLFATIYEYLTNGLFSNFIIIIANSILQLLFIVSTIVFLRNSTCLYRLYPYDFESSYYDTMLMVLKVLCSILYGFNKVCAVKANLFTFCCLVYVFVIIVLSGMTILKYRLLYLSNHEYNTFRLLACLYMFGLIIFKLIEVLLGITDTTQSTTLFILYMVGTYLCYCYINRTIYNKIFSDKDYFSIELFYFSRKYLEILEQSSVVKQKNIYEYYFELAKKLSVHGYSCKDKECMVCNNHNLSEINGTDFNTFLDDYFNFHLKKKEMKDDIYFDLLRVNCYILKTNKAITLKNNQGTSNSYGFVFDLFRHYYKTTTNRQVNLLWNFYLEILFIDEQKKINKYKNNTMLKEQVMVENFYFIFEFETVLNRVNELITLLKDNFDATIIVDKANQIYDSKKILQKYFSRTILDKDSYFNFLVNFNYKYIFNKNISKTILFDDNQELINFYEENYEKSRYFILEYIQKDKNLVIRTVPEALIKDIYYSLEELKNKRLGVLFPRFALEQLDNIITQVEANNKEIFQCKLLILDGKGFIKYLLFNFKTLIDKNMRVFLITNYAAPKIDDKNKNNLFIINEKGDIVLFSESFSKFILCDRETNNFFEIIKIKRDHILALPKLKNSKHMDIEAKELFLDGFCSYEPHTQLRINFHGTLVHNDRQCHFFEIRKLTKIQQKSASILLKEETSTMEEAVYDDEESTFHFSNSMRYTSSTVISDSTKKAINEDHLLPGIVRQNLDSFRHLFDKRPLARLEYFIYALNTILIIVGVGFLIYFDRMLNSFNNDYKSLYNIKQLQLNIYRQMACYANNMIFPGQKELFFRNKKHRFEVDNAVTIQQFRNKLISDGIKELKAFLSSIDNEHEFYNKFNTDKLNYLDIDNQKKEFVVKQDTFINIVDLLYIHLNEISDLDYFETNLDIHELRNSTSRELQSILFVTHNFFSFFSKFYKEVDKFMFTTINNNYNSIEGTVIDYYVIFIVSHILIVILLLYYLIMINQRHTTVFKFIYNFDKNHLKHLEKKFANLTKSVNSIITPSTMIHSLKEHNDINKKKELDKDDKRKEAEKFIELTNSLRGNVCKIVFSRFFVPLGAILSIYLVYFMSSLVGFHDAFMDVNIFSQYISHYFGFQTGIYESYLITRLSYISNMNLGSDLVTLKTKQDYVDNYENSFLTYMKEYRQMLAYTHNYDIFEELNYNIQTAKGPQICDIIFKRDDPLLSQFVKPSPEEVIAILKSECRLRLKADEDIIFNIFNMAQSLRKIIHRLERGVYTRTSIIEDGLFSNPIDVITTIRYYFVYIYRTYNTPILEKRLTLTYNVCIVLFVLCVTLDIICLIINKIFVLNKALRSNKVMLNFLNIIKK